jgi:hypothetical protein
MLDTIETANAYGLSLQPATDTDGAADPLALREVDRRSFDDLVHGWVPLSMALNSLNRSMGLNDFYPFVLSDTAIAKLRFVHEVIGGRVLNSTSTRNGAGASSSVAVSGSEQVDART